MKILFFFSTFILSFSLLAQTPTELRKWSAQSGHSLEAKAIGVKQNVIGLEKADGSRISLPLDKLVLDDYLFAAKHFNLFNDWGSGDRPIVGAEFKLGEVIGPIETKTGSKYFIYLPKSLKQRRLAPLLYCTHFDGVDTGFLERIVEGAELCGWVIAVSIESKSSQSTNPTERLNFYKSCLEHIVEHHPVAPRRIYFAGGPSGSHIRNGASFSYDKATKITDELKMKCVGCLTVNLKDDATFSNIRPSDVEGLDLFVISSTNNVFSIPTNLDSAQNCFYRLYVEDDKSAEPPPKLMIDGIVWLQAQYIAKYKSKINNEVIDFEVSMLQWLLQNKDKDPLRVYLNGKFFIEEAGFKLRQTELIFTKIIDQLAQYPTAEKYHEALNDISTWADEFRKVDFGMITTGTDLNGEPQKDFIEVPRNSAERDNVAKLLEKYKDYPEIESLLKSIHTGLEFKVPSKKKKR